MGPTSIYIDAVIQFRQNTFSNVGFVKGSGVFHIGNFPIYRNEMGKRFCKTG